MLQKCSTLFNIISQNSFTLYNKFWIFMGHRTEVTLKKIGNSAGFIVPASALKTLAVEVGSVLILETTDSGQMTLTPIRRRARRKIPLDQLLADWENCEYRTNPPADVAVFDKMHPVGGELL